MIFSDEQFFVVYPDRQARIRMPEPYNEMHQEFHSLGDHPTHRRRVMVWRVPEDNPFYDKRNRPLLKFPFLLFSDETVEDNDDTLMPIIRTVMMEQLQVQGSA